MIDKNYAAIRMLVLDECFLNHSSMEMSLKLGYKFDKCKRWLDDSKILKWDEFISLCEKAELDIPAAMEVIHFNEGEAKANNNIITHFKVFNSFETNNKFSEYLNCHISVVKRFIQSETIPDVDTIFKLIDYHPNLLAAFIFRLFSGNIKNTQLSNWIEKGTKVPFFMSSKSIIAIIEACLKLEQYSKRTLKTDQWLSEILGIGLEEIQINLAAMIDFGTLTSVGDDQYSIKVDVVNTQVVTFQNSIPYFQSLNKRSIEMLDRKKDDVNATSKPGIMATQIYSTSKDTMKSINEVLMKAYSDIYKLIDEDKSPHEEVCCLLLQVFTLTK